MAESKQLRLVIKNLENLDLPEVVLPEGFELKILDPDDSEMVQKWNRLNDIAFQSENDYHKVVGEHIGYYPFCTYMICKDGEMASTCTAIRDEKNKYNYGYFHMVAGDKEYSGMGLGYQVCLAALRQHKDLGCSGAWLVTDDFRLPAIAVYLKLGMLPVLEADDHKARWIEVLKNLKKDDLIPYVESLEVAPEEDWL